MTVYRVSDSTGKIHWSTSFVPGDTLLRKVPIEEFVMNARSSDSDDSTKKTRQDVAAVLDEICREYNIYPPDKD